MKTFKIKTFLVLKSAGGNFLSGLSVATLDTVWPIYLQCNGDIRTWCLGVNIVLWKCALYGQVSVLCLPARLLIATSMAVCIYVATYVVDFCAKFLLARLKYLPKVIFWMHIVTYLQFLRAKYICCLFAWYRYSREVTLLRSNFFWDCSHSCKVIFLEWKDVRWPILQPDFLW